MVSSNDTFPMFQTTILEDIDLFFLIVFLVLFLNKVRVKGGVKSSVTVAS